MLKRLRIQRNLVMRNMMKFNPRSLTFIAFITLLILAAACVTKNKTDELVMLLESKVTTFDPRNSTESSDARIQQLLFNGLTKKNEKFEPVGDLAESFESSPDYKTWTFKLRQGVKFHNGRPLTAADVKYTFDTLVQGKLKKAGELTRDNNLAMIEAPDVNTVIFRCNNALPGFANLILPIGIIPEGSAETQAKSPVGTGPFKFVSYASDQEIILAANENYFGGPSTVKTLKVKIVPDNTTRDAELRSGSGDLAINADFDPVTVESLKKAPNVKVLQSDGTNVGYLGVNMDDPLLKDVRIRQAIAYAIDREAIIRDVLLGQAKTANSVLPVTQWAYEKDTAIYNFDIEKAKDLLDQAGKKQDGDKPRFKVSLKTSTNSLSRKIGEVLQEQFRRIGIELALMPLERNVMLDDVLKGNYQLYYLQMVGGNQSTDIFKFAYHSKSVPPNGQNRMRYNNPKVDKLIDDALLAPQEQRKAIYSEIQKTLALELPQIYLWYPSAITVVRDRANGIVQDPSGDWSVVRNVKLNP